MNLKVKVFKTANYVNFFSILIFTAIASFEVGFSDSTQLSQEDFIGFLMLFLILIVYTGNFYFGLKLSSRINKETNVAKPNNTIRIIFVILEILLAIMYSVFVYYTLIQVKWTTIWPINSYASLSRLIVLICVFSGYFSSLIRLLLTKAVLKIIALHYKQLIEQIGK